MSWKVRTRWWLRTDAVVSWLLAAPGLVDPAWVALAFGVEEPTCSFLVRLWAGFLLVFGWLALQASRDSATTPTLLRSIWVEKTMVAATVLVGHLGGEVPPSLMGLVMLTNVPWIPVILRHDLALRRRFPGATPAVAAAPLTDPAGGGVSDG